jgi:torulene dioxygenase
LAEKIRKTGDLHTYTFVQRFDTCKGLLGELFSIFTPIEPNSPDTTNVSVCIRSSPTQASNKNGTTLILESDFCVIKELDPETLEPIGIAHQSTLHPLLKGPMSCAYSMTDPQTGDVFNYNLEFGRCATYRVFSVNAASGTTDILATITGQNTFPAYIHSFFLTEDFVILCIWTSYVAAGGIRVLWEENFLDALCPFDPAQKVRWLVVDRRHGCGLVAEFEGPAAFCFHTVIAWQQPNSVGGEDIICDLPEYPNLDIIHKFYYSNLMASGQDTEQTLFTEDAKRPIPASQDTRSEISTNTLSPSTIYFLPSTQAELQMTMPSPLTGEIPTTNQHYATKPNRYIYTIIDRGLPNFFDGISKADTSSQSAIFWDNPRGHTPGEAIFVNDPNGAEEDDGVLLSVVLDGFRGMSYLLCLGARDLREVERVDVEAVVGFGYPGGYFKADGAEKG